MVRRILAVCLIFAVLLQNVPMSHSHAGTGQPLDHDQLPHFHFSQFFISCSWLQNHNEPIHHHGHSHGGGHHNHDADTPSETPPPEEPIPADHDSDCVYLPVTVVMCKSESVRTARSLATGLAFDCVVTE